MSCPAYKRLCDNLVVSDSVTFNGASVLVDLPTGSYNNNQKYCIVIGQTIPTTATISAPVLITIGGDTDTTYPLINCNYTPVLACSINTRTRYTTCVRTTSTGGSFVLKGKLPCSRCASNLVSLPAPTAAAPDTTT